MSRIENRRNLLAAVDALVKTRSPDAEHYNAVLDALSAVATDDIGTQIKAILARAGTSIPGGALGSRQVEIAPRDAHRAAAAIGGSK